MINKIFRCVGISRESQVVRVVPKIELEEGRNEELKFPTNFARKMGRIYSEEDKRLSDYSLENRQNKI